MRAGACRTSAPMVEPSHPFGLRSLVQLPDGPWFRWSPRTPAPPRLGPVLSQEKWLGTAPGSLPARPEGRLELLALRKSVLNQGVPLSTSGPTPTTRSTSPPRTVPRPQRPRRDRRQDPGRRDVPLRKPSPAEQKATAGRSRSTRTTGRPSSAAGCSIASNRSHGPARPRTAPRPRAGDPLDRDDRVDPAPNGTRARRWPRGIPGDQYHRAGRPRNAARTGPGRCDRRTRPGPGGRLAEEGVFPSVNAVSPKSTTRGATVLSRHPQRNTSRAPPGRLVRHGRAA